MVGMVSFVVSVQRFTIACKEPHISDGLSGGEFLLLCRECIKWFHSVFVCRNDYVLIEHI